MTNRMQNLKIALLPGSWSIRPANWIQEIGSYLEEAGIEVYWRNLPDRLLARQAYWMSYLQETVRADNSTILVGFSTGAVAAMRYAEQHEIFGSILVAPYHSDLGNPVERLSGYFGRPWAWQAIRDNQHWIVQFSSTDDPYIPIGESRQLHEYLRSDYYEGPHRHFIQTRFPKLMTVLKSKLAQLEITNSTGEESY